jgi:maleate cis-trans isomerase
MGEGGQISGNKSRMKLVVPWFQLGYIIPHRYTDLDAYQFYRVAPEGMMLVTTGLDLTEYTLASVEAQMPAFHSCLDLLAKKPVDRIALSGVPIAAALGRDRTLRLMAEASDRTGLACDTDLEAHIDTLKHLGISRIALVTRWSEAVTGALIAYLKSAGIEVLAFRTRGRSLAQNKGAGALADHALALELGRDVLQATPHADALLMPGGLWFAMHAVPILEAEFNKPVLLNILSTCSSALRAHARRHPSAEIPRADPHWGMVLAS